MKELRSTVHALFFFAVFLLAYALVTPGSAGRWSGGHGPRFFRMEIEDLCTSGRPEKVTVSVPFFLYRGGLNLASRGRLRREMDLHFDEPVAADMLRDVWSELSKVPDGTPVTRNNDSVDFEFTKQGTEVVLKASEERGSGEEPGAERFTLRFPARYLQALVSGERDLDVRALIDELTRASRGDVVDLKTQEAHLHVTID